MEASVSCVIPTLNAEKEIGPLLEALLSQSVPPAEIIVIDSESADRTAEIAAAYDRVRVIPIRRKDFDHGGTRDKALQASKGNYVVFLTQDALPADSMLIENLLKPFFQDDLIATVTGRQLPRPGAAPMEKLVRTYNYPDQSNVHSSADIPQMGIKTFFASDVCAAYRRDYYEKLGGFEHPIRISEDMMFAAKALRNGYRAAYAAEAKVIHSHNFTLKEQYKRNYLQGYEIERHRNLLDVDSLSGEGLHLVKYVSIGLLKEGRIVSFIRFFFDCCARLMGNRRGRRAAMQGGTASASSGKGTN